MIIYCDGSAYPNPGPGGFGVIVLDKSKKIVYHIHRESSKDTTNNREELKAILYCLKHFGKNIFEEKDNFSLNIPTVYSDSAYAINTYTNWMFSWSENNWYKKDSQKAENLDIIQEYFDLYSQGYRIDLQKIKGHSGDFWHDFADQLAANKIPLWRLKNE